MTNDQIEAPGVPRGFRNAPADIKERAAALVRDFGSNSALLEGAIVAALETERLASSPDQVKRETIEACARVAESMPEVINTWERPGDPPGIGVRRPAYPREIAAAIRSLNQGK